MADKFFFTPNISNESQKVPPFIPVKVNFNLLVAFDYIQNRVQLN